MATITTYTNVREIPEDLKPGILDHTRVTIQAKGVNVPGMVGKKCMPFREILKEVNFFLQERGVSVTKKALNGLLHKNRAEISRSAEGKPIWCVAPAGRRAAPAVAAAPAASSTLKKRAPAATTAKRPAAKKRSAATLVDWSPEDYAKLKEEGLSKTEGEFIKFLKEGVKDGRHPIVWKFHMEEIPESGPSPPIAIDEPDGENFPIDWGRVFVLLASEGQRSEDGFTGKGHWIMADNKRIGTLVSVCGKWGPHEQDHIAHFGVIPRHRSKGYGTEALKAYLDTKHRAATVTAESADPEPFLKAGFTDGYDPESDWQGTGSPDDTVNEYWDSWIRALVYRLYWRKKKGGK